MRRKAKSVRAVRSVAKQRVATGTFERNVKKYKTLCDRHRTREEANGANEGSGAGNSSRPRTILREIGRKGSL